MLVLTVVLSRGAAPLADGAPEAPPTVEPKSPYFNGTYLSAVVGGGFGMLADDTLGGRFGPSVSVSGRLAMMLQLLDTELGYRFSSYDVTADGGDVQLQRHAILFDLKIHPLFLILMAGKPSLAGIYAQAGLSAEIARADAPSLALDDTAAGVGVHVGAGFDIPLTDPSRGSSFWLGFNYQANFVDVDLGVEALDDLDEHQFSLQLHYRDNNLQYFHMSRPEDFGFR